MTDNEKTEAGDSPQPEAPPAVAAAEDKLEPSPAPQAIAVEEPVIEAKAEPDAPKVEKPHVPLPKFPEPSVTVEHSEVVYEHEALKVTKESEVPAAIKADPLPPVPTSQAGRKLDIISFIHEPPPIPRSIDAKLLKAHTRRDFLIYGASALAAATGCWWLLPEETQKAHLTAAQQKILDSLETRVSPTLAAKSGAVKNRFLGRVLTFDDDVSAALFSPTRSVPTYSADMITPNLRNNYDGQTPDPGYIDTWRLELSGLASGKTEKLPISLLKSRFPMHQQITRLVCVEGWSAIAGWGGLRFADLLAAYPPKPGAKWAKLISDVNLDGEGNSDPYFVSIDLTTAIHPQSLLATHHDGKTLELEHGAPLRLIVPMKLGLKNIKAITRIEYSIGQPSDYWNEQGYSKYDGL